ncbi:MAG: phosphocholine cytidylyltransferase family protein [Salinivirgaceae bacterium]|jgi:choline kinase|nr:phosphocholine cytidylyltransferase family protein [Salinivirgaceae bacterium]
METRAIILAAGRGSRMGDATASKPKCLNTLAGKTLLEWQLKSLNEADLNFITVVGGYRRELLQGNFKVVANERWDKTNMVASLFCAEAFSGNTIISYSDITYHPEHVKKLNASEADITITADKYWDDLWKLRFQNPLDDAETFKSDGDKLIEIGKKTNDISNIEAQYMGLIKLSAKGWDKMYDLYQSFSESKKDKMDMTTMLNELLDNGTEINVVFIEGKWCEADDYDDILAYEKELKGNTNWKHNWQ